MPMIEISEEHLSLIWEAAERMARRTRHLPGSGQLLADDTTPAQVLAAILTHYFRQDRRETLH